MSQITRGAIVTSVLTIMCASHDALAWNTNERACLRGIKSVPTNYQPPQIDGEVVNDLGWTTDWSYQKNDGTTSPSGAANVDAAFQVLGNAQYVYVSAEVFDDISLDASDRILIGFDNGAANRELWDITARGSVDPGQPDIQRYRWNGTVWQPTPAPDGLLKASRTSGTNPYAWTIELRIPRSATVAAGINLPSTGDFGLYMNAARVWQTDELNDVAYYPWP